MSINIPGLLLAIFLIWSAVVYIGLSDAFGIFTFATGIVWAIVSIGVHTGVVGTKQG